MGVLSDLAWQALFISPFWRVVAGVGAGTVVLAGGFWLRGHLRRREARKLEELEVKTQAARAGGGTLEDLEDILARARSRRQRIKELQE